MTELLILLALIVLNGVFAMSEISVVSAKRARLMQMVERGDRGAALALDLNAEPTKFLSTVQVGITSIGILSGAVGEGAIADKLRVMLEPLPVVGPYAGPISLVGMVLVLTYVSLIIGELVPKRLGLTNPEKIASLVAGPMRTLAAIGRPLVFLLTSSTELVLRLLRISSTRGQSVSPEEIDILMQQGHDEGVFDKAEQELVSNVLDLDERHVGAILTPRSDVVYLDVSEPFDVSRTTLIGSPHNVLPVCRGSLDEVVGFVRSTDVLAHVLRGDAPDLLALASPPLFVPRTVTLMDLLQQFRQTHLPVALVVDEFGVVSGLVSLTDVVAAIVGDLPATADEEQAVVVRPDGSLLVDGAVEIDTLETRLDTTLLSDNDRRHYHTVGGLAMFTLARVPRVGDRFECAGYQFEIVDMDGNRVDRVLVTSLARP